ncbi:MAG: hypothetical protein F7C38_01310 [Desulfurococcales archaeon]|nr:hypothetical protein [Desulfurococcales archaeon]
MKAYTLKLTVEEAQSCRTKPAARLALLLLEMKEGDYLEVEGEDMYYPYRNVKSILTASGLEIVEEEYDGLTYKIVARKPA